MALMRCSSSAPCSSYLTNRAQVNSLKDRYSSGGRNSMQCRASGEWMDAIHGVVIGVGVGLPCTVMDCGDVVYRSTLPKSNEFQLTTGGAALVLSVVAYMWATPGVAPALWDMFLLAPIERKLRPSYRKDDFILGKKIGEGAFGTVYKATFAKDSKSDALVVKKANEYGEVEAWMNERVRRACASSCADYIDGFLQRSSQKKQEYWLVWRFEGEATLADFISSKDFPYNIEEALSLRTKLLPKGIERENLIIRSLIQQLLKGLKSLHETGIVHRDVKPQNIIYSEKAKCFKIIDLGAATDLRVGINYTPKEFLLDPRYAAPEQYIMSTQTPSAPPAPIAAALSPVLWQMNLPDRFDIYSAGLIFLQMAFPGLRSDSALIQFNKQLKQCEYDLREWRKMVEPRANAEMQRGFEILDLDEGGGWELLENMILFKSRQRISASAALALPYFVKMGILGSATIHRLWLQLVRTLQQDRTDEAIWIMGLMAKSGTKEAGGFTEAQLQELMEKPIPKKSTAQRNAMASAIKMRRKVVRTMNQSLGELQKKSKKKLLWWMQSIDEGLNELESSSSKRRNTFWWS